jgi:Zn-dependent protease with chaperone function
VSRLFFETDADERCPIEFGGPSDVLVYFVSLAFATRYGSQHPLSQLSLLLRGERKINMTPLTTFADRNVEVEADRIELERVWQDAGPLAETLRGVTDALASGDARFAELTADHPDLRDRLDDLRRMAEWAAERGVRVRLSFEL